MLAAIATMIAGCGSSGRSGTTADPAGAVPATAAIYLGADVRPSGNEKSSALAVGRALTHTGNPYLRLLQALATPGSATLDFGHDVAPWLGPHAGVFLSSLAGAGALLAPLEQALLGSAPAPAVFPFGARGAQGAIVLDTTDTAKARSFLDGQAARASAAASSYRGITYKLSAGGVALGMVGRFAVIGSESGMHSVIDTTHGGAALVHGAGYAKLLAAAPAGVLAHLYTNPTAAQGSGSHGGAAGLLSLLAGSREADISLVPAAGSLTLYADTSTSSASGAAGGLLSSGVEGSHALEELPGGSWLAAGLGHLGATLGQDIVGLRELAALGTSLAGPSTGGPSGPLSLKSLITGLITPLSVLATNTTQARRAFTSWMGSGAVYASGSGLLELKGAIVIESKNAALSRAAVGKLAAALGQAGNSSQPVTIPGTDAAVAAKVTGLPLPLYIANGRSAGGGTKFVLGLGEASVTEALSPANTLASATARTAAATALGEGLRPSVMFDLPTLLGLLEGVGLTEDPTISKLLPSLRAITTIDGGGHALGGEVERFKLTLGVH
jgi:hypothetical protein